MNKLIETWIEFDIETQDDKLTLMPLLKTDTTRHTKSRPVHFWEQRAPLWVAEATTKTNSTLYLDDFSKCRNSSWADDDQRISGVVCFVFLVFLHVMLTSFTPLVAHVNREPRSPRRRRK